MKVVGNKIILYIDWGQQRDEVEPILCIQECRYREQNITRRYPSLCVSGCVGEAISGNRDVKGVPIGYCWDLIKKKQRLVYRNVASQVQSVQTPEGAPVSMIVCLSQ